MTVEGHRVFDAHLHVQPWSTMRPAVRAFVEGRPDAQRLEAMEADPKAVVEFLDGEGIDRAVVVNYVAPDVSGFTESANAFGARLARGIGDRVVAVGSVHPHRFPDAATVAAAVEALLADGIRAFKLHPSHQLVNPLAYLPPEGDERLRTLYATLERRGVPLIVHTGTSVFPGARNRFADPMLLDDVAVDFPGLVLVLAHAGRPLWVPTATFLARRHANVHLDISGIPPRKLLEYLPNTEALHERILFGSDWPGPGVRSVRENVRDFLALPLSAEAKESILWENASRLFASKPS